MDNFCISHRDSFSLLDSLDSTHSTRLSDDACLIGVWWCLLLLLLLLSALLQSTTSREGGFISRTQRFVLTLRFIVWVEAHPKITASKNSEERRRKKRTDDRPEHNPKRQEHKKCNDVAFLFLILNISYS